MGDKTVILTTVNGAWAANNSLLDLFLESFHIGNNTKRLLNHLVIIALDQKSYARCLALHPLCYALKTEGVDFSGEAYYSTPNYLEMMWRRIDFLPSILTMGYSFIFTVLLSSLFFSLRHNMNYLLYRNIIRICFNVIMVATMTSLMLDYFQTINIMFISLLDVACIMQMFQFSNAMKCNRSKMIQRDSEGEF